MKITRTKIAPMDEHVDAVKQLKAPRNVSELRHILGLFQYLCWLISGYAKIAKCLFKKIKKSVEAFTWDNECQQAMNALIMTEKPYLKPPIPNQGCELHTDTFIKGVGCILLQKQEDGKWGVVGNCSRTTRCLETRQGPFFLELLAICFGLHYFWIFIYSQEVNIISDCQH